MALIGDGLCTTVRETWSGWNRTNRTGGYSPVFLALPLIVSLSWPRSTSSDKLLRWHGGLSAKVNRNANLGPIFWDEVSFKSGLVASLLIYSYCHSMDASTHWLQVGACCWSQLIKQQAWALLPFLLPFLASRNTKIFVQSYISLLRVRHL